MRIAKIIISPFVRFIHFFVRSQNHREFFLKIKLVFIGPLLTLLGIFVLRKNVNNSIVPFLISFYFLNIVDNYPKEIFKYAKPHLEKLEEKLIKLIDIS